MVTLCSDRLAVSLPARNVSTVVLVLLRMIVEGGSLTIFVIFWTLKTNIDVPLITDDK